jgi:hypothetical protein
LVGFSRDGFCPELSARELDDPGLGDGDGGEELFDAPGVCEVGVFEIEASGLEVGEEGLDAPTLLIELEGVPGFEIGGDDEELAGGRRRSIAWAWNGRFGGGCGGTPGRRGGP